MVERVERLEAAAQDLRTELQTTQESLKAVIIKLSVIDDLAKKLDEVVEEAFYLITEMKKAADLADAKEVQIASTTCGNAMAPCILGNSESQLAPMILKLHSLTRT